MASWMVHLRVADRLLDRLEGIREKEFIMGNIAPDSGVPNADWTAYAPPTEVSHFKTYLGDRAVKIDVESYLQQYFTVEKRKKYSPEQYSFYLGYLIHLLRIWSGLPVYIIPVSPDIRRPMGRILISCCGR